MEKFKRFIYNSTQSGLSELHSILNEKGQEGSEAFAVSCFGSGPRVLVLFRKPMKD